MSDVRPSAHTRSAGPDGIPWRWVLVAAAVGVIVRLAFSLFYWTGRPLTRDEMEYLSLARSLAAGHGFVYDSVLLRSLAEPFGRAPGYPAFLAMVGGGSAVTDSTPVAVQVAQSVFGGVGVIMAGLLAHRMAGTRAAIGAAALAAVYPPLVWVSGYALSEALFWPVGLAVAWLFDRMVTGPHRVASSVACGILTGLGVLIRPALVFVVPLAMFWLFAKRQPQRAAGLLLGLALVVSPWTIRNYLHHGKVMFVASDGGVTFWTGNHPLAIGEGDMAANPSIKLDNQRLRASHPGLSEAEFEPLYYREALAWIRTHPLDWVALEFRKLFYLVVPVGPSYTLHSTRYFVLSVGSYAAVLALALTALARRVPRRPTPGLWLLAASSIAVALVFFPQERFRIPILDPTLVILGGVALTNFSAWGRRA